MRTWIATVLLAAACSHGQTAAKSSQPMPLASGASCDQMTAHVVQIAPGGADVANGEVGKKVAAVLQERCTTDAWSAQARQCLFDLKDMREADQCKQYLTKAQIDAADKQMDATLPLAQAPATGAADKPEPSAGEAPPAQPAPPASTRAPQKKKPAGSSKSSGDPCMGGE